MIYIEEQCICTYEEHSDEQYGDWSADYSYSIKGATIAKPKTYDYCEVPDITAEVGDIVYVLYIVYGSGDSFGHSSGNGQFVCAYTDEAMADHAKRIALQADRCGQAGQGQLALKPRHAAAQQPPARATRNDHQHKQQQRQTLDPLQHASPRWPNQEVPAAGRPQRDYSMAQ